ncbi:hypothetical protein AAG570_002969 [Ranatra chinensis]|uniref:CRAL-TRIO domain-containing protein n=1 Tax=Ranatra chinensis TaxID=642074 RepID=A0ABD0Y5V4_9HEMI
MTLVQPTEEMQTKIRVDLNEDVTTRDKDLEHIKQWLHRQPHLPHFDDDGRIMTFLRGCKFSLEKTKKKLDMYFTMRTAVPEFFSNRDPERPEINQMPPLPGVTPNGLRVVAIRGVLPGDGTSPIQQLPSIPEAMKVCLMIADIRLREEFQGVAGDVYILDASIVTANNFAQNFSKFTPTLVKKFLVCVQEAYPVKLKEVHVVNVTPLVDTIINFVKPFLKEKIKNRIHVHSNFESLYKFIPKENLPVEYGGTCGNLEDFNNQWYEKMVTYKDWYKQQEDVKADESARPGKPKTHDDLFGVEGSFKKLTID